MNNLCCTVNPIVWCYYCDTLWCSDCWAEESKEREYRRCAETDPIKTKGKWTQGGHYTAPTDYDKQKLLEAITEEEFEFYRLRPHKKSDGQ